MGPGGAPVTVDLPTVDIPAGGRLVLMQASGEGGVQTVYVVFDINGTPVDGGTVADNDVWPVGADTAQPLGVLLSWALNGSVSEIDTFLANGAQFAPASLNDGWLPNPDPAVALDVFGDSGTFNGKVATQEVVAPGIFDVYSPISLADLVDCSPIAETFFLDIKPNNIFARVDNADTDTAADWTTGEVPTVGQNNDVDDYNPQDPYNDNMKPGQAFGNLVGPDDETDSNGQNVIIAGVNDADFLNEETGAIEGGKAQDFVIGDEGSNTLDGGSHNDYLDGGAGNDMMDGSSGGDVLIDDQGRDMMIGGTGTDILFGRRDPVEDTATGTGDDKDIISGDDVDAQSQILSLIGKGGAYDPDGDLLIGDETIRGGWDDNRQQVLATAALAVGGGGNGDFGDPQDYMRDIIVAGDGSDIIYGDNAGLASGFGPDNITSLYFDILSAFYSNSDLEDGAWSYEFANQYRGYVDWNYGGADLIYGGAGNDMIFGQGGDDGILAGSGADLVAGGSGNDKIRGNDGDDALFGDTGDDTIYGDAGRDYIEGNEGADSLFGGAGNDTMRGGDGADTMHGEQDDDTMFGDAGADNMHGGSGEDVLYGGADNDVMFGNAGADIMYGEAGDDTMDGGDGNDRMSGGDGNDTMDGGADDDRMSGGSGNDLVMGGLGADFIGGSDGDDTVQGGEDDDTVYGSAGLDTVTGDSGDDVLYGGYDEDDLSGGEGHDVMYGDNGNPGFGPSLENDTMSGGAGNDTMYGEDDGDLMYGDAGDDVMYGEDGNGSVYGGDGFEKDTLYGGAGNDVMYGGTDDDVLYGGADNDVMFGNAGADVMYGEAGDDTMRGNDGDDDMQGGDGNDTMHGGDDDDRMDGGAGDDTLNGGAHDDLMYGGTDDDMLLGDNGEDQIFGEDGEDSMAGGQDDDLLYGGAGNDSMLGGSGEDLMFGDAHDDTMRGDAGDDVMLGGTGNDVMEGGTDDDTLTGEDGSDTVSGEDGDDVLRWTAADNSDGSADIYDGGDNDDTLELYFTEAEFLANEEAIAEFANRLENGEDNVTLTIGAKTLTASDIEYVHVHVDGFEVPVLIDDTFTTDEDTDLTEQLTATLGTPQQDFVPNDVSKPTTFSQPGDVTITPAGGGVPIVIAAASWGGPVGGVWTVNLVDGPNDYGILRVDASNPDAAMVTLEVGSTFGSMNDGDVATVVFNYNAEVEGTETAQVTINVNGADEDGPIVAVDDVVITNSLTEIYIPEYGLLINDVDPEGDPLSVDNVENPPAAQDVLDYVNVMPADLDFDYDATDGDNSDTANVVVETQSGNFLLGDDRNEIVIGSQGADTIGGGGGDDTIAGGAGNDRIFGDGGADTFHYYGPNTAGVGGGNTDGDDTIVDFDAGEGDVINLDALFDALGVADAELRADRVNIVDDGTDTTITVDDGVGTPIAGFSITLDGHSSMGSSDGTLTADQLEALGIQVSDES